MMETKIKAVQDYFIEQIITGQFEVVTVEQYTMKVMIDKKYSFTIWISSTSEPTARKVWDSGDNFIILKMTDEQAIELDKTTSVIIKRWQQEIGKELKLKQIADLQKEIESWN